MTVLREGINDHQNAVEMAGAWQTFNKIQRNSLPCCCRNWQWLEKSRQLGTVWLSLLTCDTILDKVTSCRFHSSPFKHLLQTRVGNWKSRMTPQSARVSGLKKLMLKISIGPYPNAWTMADNTATQRESRNGLRVEGELSQHVSCYRILGIASHNLLYPKRRYHREGRARRIMSNLAGKGISRTVGGARLINNAKLETNQLGEKLLLPRSMEPLIRQLDQTLLIGIYDELNKLKVGSPLLNDHQNCHIFFLICAKTTGFRPQSSTKICKRMTILSQNSTNTTSTCIGLNTERLSKIR